MFRTLTFEAKAVEDFFRDFDQGKFEEQRLGQAFYDKFRLNMMRDPGQWASLYEMDGDKARNVIKQNVVLH